MKNLIGLLIGLVGCWLFYISPESMPDSVVQAWGSTPFSMPITETGYWLLGLSAGLGYLLWWILGLLLRSDAGFSTVLVLAVIFGLIGYYGNGITFIQVGLLIGCSLFSLIASLSKSGARSAADEASAK